jgi:hypothetical protein
VQEAYGSNKCSYDEVLDLNRKLGSCQNKTIETQNRRVALLSDFLISKSKAELQ